MSGSAPVVRWLGSGQLGLFDEKTQGECLNNVANKTACYGICITAGAGGWSTLLLPICQDVCMLESCGKGILLTPFQLQAALSKMGSVEQTCLKTCVLEASTLPDAAARDLALSGCLAKCGVVVHEPDPAAPVPAPQPVPQPLKETKTERPVWPWVLGGLVLVGGVALALRGAP